MGIYGFKIHVVLLFSLVFICLIVLFFVFVAVVSARYRLRQFEGYLKRELTKDQKYFLFGNPS